MFFTIQEIPLTLAGDTRTPKKLTAIKSYMSELLIWASVTTLNMSGLGLSYTVDFLTGYSGTMQLTTDDIHVSLSTDGQLNTTKLKYKICGTRIFMEFPIV